VSALVAAIAARVEVFRDEAIKRLLRRASVVVGSSRSPPNQRQINCRCRPQRRTAGARSSPDPRERRPGRYARARDESERTLELGLTWAPAIGVQSNMSWPCGQDSQPKPECRQRRVRHEAWGAGSLVLTAGPAPTGVIPPARWSRPYLIHRAKGS